MKHAPVGSARGQLPGGGVIGHGAQRAAMQRQVPDQGKIGQAPQTHVPVVVSREHERGRFIHQPCR